MSGLIFEPHTPGFRFSKISVKCSVHNYLYLSLCKMQIEDFVSCTYVHQIPWRLTKPDSICSEVLSQSSLRSMISRDFSSNFLFIILIFDAKSVNSDKSVRLSHAWCLSFKLPVLFTLFCNLLVFTHSLKKLPPGAISFFTTSWYSI